MTKVTKHAEKRMKERSGLEKKSIDRMAAVALKKGLSHSDTKGNLNKWVTKLWFTNKNANNIRIYGDKAYIFANETLITVIQVPSNLIHLVKACKKETEEQSR